MEQVKKATARERIITYLKGKEQVSISELKSYFKDIPYGTLTGVISLLHRTGLFTVSSVGNEKYIFLASTKPIDVDTVLLKINEVEVKSKNKGKPSRTEKPTISYDHIIELAQNLLSALRVNKAQMKKFDKMKELFKD